MSPSGAELLRQSSARSTRSTRPRCSELIGEGVAIIDVRETEEFASGHLPGAKHVPARAISRPASRASSRIAMHEIVLYCASGNRSAYGARTLHGGPRLRERRFDDRRHHAVEGPRL